MPRLRVAHVREQGADIIIVPLGRSFDQKTEAEQEDAIIELQMRATAAQLAGHVVPVWDAGGGRMRFIAPPNWHPFFRSISLRSVAANLNKELCW